MVALDCVYDWVLEGLVEGIGGYFVIIPTFHDVSYF